MPHTPRKRFGQHFLADANVVAAIVHAIAPRREDRMVEIGPGLGALTRPLLIALDHLHAVEIDRDAVARLTREFPATRLTVHAADALAYDFSALCPPGAMLRVVGNLPYNISTPLLFHLAEYSERIADCHFMLQKEVVERMVAAPGGRDFGRLSVMLQYRFEMENLFEVPPEAFDPPPRVDSAIVRMRPRPVAALEARDMAGFAALVTRAFSQRRKTLHNTLKGFASDAQMQAVGIDPAARAETIGVAAFVRLANLLAAGAHAAA
ncbi:MAG: 16S rRNA (adenine(1518)-N(6)/adenine(1519)-N(6))-dimethyltransferase RsmA [Burkholderiales bacterium]